MPLKVNPNRMELLKLKKRASVARRGHKLLKDKLDELMKQFLALVHQARSLRLEAEERLSTYYQMFALARAEMSTAVIEEALFFPRARSLIEVSFRNIINIAIPEFRLERQESYDCYGLATTPAILDKALESLDKTLPLLIRLAEVEKAIDLLADEIERTRRRVNALEYVVIPQIEETIVFIAMKLDEMERASLTRLMKIKKMVAPSS